MLTPDRGGAALQRAHRACAGAREAGEQQALALGRAAQREVAFEPPDRLLVAGHPQRGEGLRQIR